MTTAFARESEQRKDVKRRPMELREDLRWLVEENGSAEPAELARVDKERLLVDSERRERLEAQSKKKVAEVRERFVKEVEQAKRAMEEIKRRCFDSMKTRKSCVTTFSCEERDEVLKILSRCRTLNFLSKRRRKMTNREKKKKKSNDSLCGRR